MIRPASMLFIVAAALIALGVAAPSAASREMSARQLVDHLYIVQGQLPIQTLIVEMEASALPSQEKGGTGNLMPASRSKMFFKRPNKLHTSDVLVAPGDPMDGKQQTFISDGVNCWLYVSMGQYPVKKAPDPQEGTSWLPFNIQSYPKDAQKEYTLIGKDTVDRVACQVVRIADPSDPKSSVTVWIDNARWVPLRKEIVRASGSGGANSGKRILYKDIRKLKDGRFFPHLLEMYEADVLTKAGVYKAVGVNEPLPDSLFEPMKKFLK